jgi:hypothetical protein
MTPPSLQTIRLKYFEKTLYVPSPIRLRSKKEEAMLKLCTKQKSDLYHGVRKLVTQQTESQRLSPAIKARHFTII